MLNISRRIYWVAKKWKRRAAALWKRTVHKRTNDGSIEWPNWFIERPDEILKGRLTSGRPILLYIPWIEGHTDAIITPLSGGAEYDLVPLNLIRDLGGQRKQAMDFAKNNPHLFRRMIMHRLLPLRDSIRGIVFTFDWAPFMHGIAQVCGDLDIFRILIPHEAIFANEAQYYTDIDATFASIPVADKVFVWGERQRRVFVQRGYPSERIEVTGTPKFDPYVPPHGKSHLSRKQFHTVFGLDPGRKTLVFTLQVLDKQFGNVAQARDAQISAVSRIFSFAQNRGHNFLLRMPPADAPLLPAELIRTLMKTPGVAVDVSPYFMVSPEETLHHADLVLAFNSTMLLEAVLAGSSALAIRGTNFAPFFERYGMPIVNDLGRLEEEMEAALCNGSKPPAEGIQLTAEELSVGVFDGRSTERIRIRLNEIIKNPQAFPLRPSAKERFFSLSGDTQLDVVGTHMTAKVLSESAANLVVLANARKLTTVRDDTNSLRKASAAEIFLQWGITENPAKENMSAIQRTLGRPKIIVEDGFIRSMKIGLEGEPGCSIIMDDITAYYDATRPSRLALLLQDGPELSAQERERAWNAINLIVRTKVSKYNSATENVQLGDANGRKRLLIIDQRAGDQSIISGLAGEDDFHKMVRDALHRPETWEILIKRHPDSIVGGKSGYFTNDALQMLDPGKRIRLIDTDTNPYSLFEQMDEVYTVTSGMGFEALMAGKPVWCFGMPFYAGWGATEDKKSLGSRTRKRGIEEIFHFSYIQLSRYCHPEKRVRISLEELVKYFAECKLP